MDDRALRGLARRYLPPAFATRAPVGPNGWRTRTALVLWALGYPLEMAWAIAMDRHPASSRRFRSSVSRLDDARLVDLLDATTEARGDGRELSFVAFLEG
jgi:hypothetical protein